MSWWIGKKDANLQQVLAETGWTHGIVEYDHPLIICCGHGRTGTSSLTEALQILGYSADHYSGRTMELVRQAEKSGAASVDWHQFTKVDAVVDAPVPSFYLELLARFPRAKVILTVREPSSWLASHNRHYCKFAEKNPSSVLSASPLHLNRDSNTFYAPGMDTSPNRMLDFGTNYPSDQQALKRYVAHNLEVMRTVASDRLLVLDIVAGDGWEPLCTFLNTPQPDVPFPHANASDVEATLLD